MKSIRLKLPFWDMMEVLFLEMLNVTWLTVSIHLKFGLKVKWCKEHMFGCLCFVNDWCVPLDSKFNGLTCFTST